MSVEPRSPRVVVVGGGVAGLVVAYRLARSPGSPEVTVLEGSDRLGGKLAAMDLGGMTIEAGADSFVVRKPWAMDLCRELGLEGRVIHPDARGAFVWARGRLVPYPESAAFGVPAEIEELVRWPGLSRAGRRRALLDLYRPRRKGDADESLGALVTRRMGRECAEVLVGPLLAGISAGDPDRLSAEATFPELRRWEAGHGSLIRGARAARRRAAEDGAGPLFATLEGGLARLVSALADGVGPDRIRTRARATAVRPEGTGFAVDVEGPAATSVQADAVVLATPAFGAAELVRSLSPDAARDLASIPYANTAVVALAYPEGSAELLPAATGFVVPAGTSVAGRDATITACTWVSRKWPTGSFGSRAVVRAFVGRAGDERALSMTDPELVAAVVRDLEAISPVGQVPDAAAVTRWDRAMPQYEVGHLERVSGIDRALDRVPGLFVTGSSYRGLGVADCVRQANETAERVRAHLERTSIPEHGGARHG